MYIKGQIEANNPTYHIAITEGRINKKIVYEIFVISKSQDFFERFLGFLRDFWGFFDEFLRDF